MNWLEDYGEKLKPYLCNVAVELREAQAAGKRILFEAQLGNEQDDNDLTKATRYCLEQGWHKIAYVGATGKREDHTLGNISLMVRYFLEMGVEPVLVTDYGWFVVAQGDTVFESFPGQQVSIFNVNCRHLVSEGLKWQAYPFRQFWQGTLNEALSTDFSLHADGCYLVYRTFS